MNKAVSNLGASIGIVVILFACAISAVPQPKVTARKEVKVYFYHDPGEYIDLAPVTRSVSAVAPARPAIEALLKGPTAAERRRGFGPLASASDFRIGSLKISGGTARVNFVSTRRWHGWPGDLAPVRFKTAVELTLKQFPTVKRVIVSLNGDAKFYDERGASLVHPENSDILSKPLTGLQDFQN
jgi:spore germination protein GerM